MTAGYMDIAGGLQDTPERREARMARKKARQSSCDHYWVHVRGLDTCSGGWFKSCLRCEATEYGEV